MCYHFEKFDNKHQILVKVWSWACRTTVLDNYPALSYIIEQVRTYAPGISLFGACLRAELPLLYALNRSRWVEILNASSPTVGESVWHCWSPQVCCL